MSSAADVVSPVSDRRTVLIPQFDRAAGPVTRRLNTRLFAGFGIAWAVALGLIVAAPPAGKAFGLGVIVPGAGFLYGGHVGWAVVALVAVVVAFNLWLLLSTEMIIVPAWLFTALLGACLVDTESAWVLWAAPVLFALLVSGVAVTHRLATRRQRRRGRTYNEQLERVEFPISAANPAPRVTESSPAELDALRYPLGLLLQPIDRYDGFSKLDQFREGALRYQLNWAQFGLATAQFTRTPAFTGYLSEAQRNAITKVRQPLNWRYWRLENLWGNGEWNPDPIRRMNIMLPGFYGVSVGLYQSVTGDERYLADEALTFTDRNGTGYAYDYASMSDCVVRDVERSAMKLQPCEPSWIYSICNTFTLNSLLLHHRLNDNAAAGVALGEVVSNYQREFIRPDGQFTTFRAKRGPAWPMAHNWSDAMIAAFGNPAMPDVARRTWWLLRERMGDVEDLKTTWMDRIDLGNYMHGSDVAMRIAMMVAAREMGDDDMDSAMRAHLDANFSTSAGPGEPLYRRASVLANLQGVHAMFMRENVLRDMIAFDVPAQWHSGPVLAECAYPAVLVARAVSDGHDLQLVLRPGAGAVRTTLRVERLVPGRGYLLTGAVESSVVADEQGAVLFDVDLGDRLDVTVRPQS